MADETDVKKMKGKHAHKILNAQLFWAGQSYDEPSQIKKKLRGDYCNNNVSPSLTNIFFSVNTQYNTAHNYDIESQSLNFVRHWPNVVYPPRVLKWILLIDYRHG